MSLRIRRGLEADRLSITPDEGEYLYTTDTKKIYIGDGTTPGGNLVVGGVTSIATTSPITGGTITSTGTIGITKATTSTDGYLSSTDWNTFNNKQGALTLTTTGTSGASSLIGNTLNIPQYTDQYTGTVTSVSAGTGMSFSTITSSGSVSIDNTKVPYLSSGFSSGFLKYNGSSWSFDNNTYLTQTAADLLYYPLSSNPAGYLTSSSLSGYVQNTRTLTINGTTYDLSANRTWSVGTVTSVGLSMPSAFTVTNSPVIGSGTLTVTGAGLVSQYVRGDGSLANFPTGGGGGGASVSYYFNGGTSQGTFGGNTYYQMSKSAVIGTAANFTISATGYIAQFLTDAGDPNLLNIPAGNWNIEAYFSASSPGGSPSFYVELYKYNGTSFTLIASNSTTPEVITGGTAVDLYMTSLAVPATTLSLTDRLAIRVYVNHDSRTITLYTQDAHLCQVITTFTTGLTALNGLTSQVQYLATGTSGTDFNISSSTDTHTFNIPNASATARGLINTNSQTIAGAKTFSTAPILSSLTASQILALDASNNIQTLSTATYPSLTELSYVKGVTSSLQTQLNGKQATGNYITALTGDVTASGPGSAAATIANSVVTLAKMANLTANTIIGNNTGVSATPLALTGTQVTAMLDTFSTSSTTKGLVPGSNSVGATYYLDGSGNWSVPSGGGGGVSLDDVVALAVAL